jgi:DNA adenine methylase
MDAPLDLRYPGGKGVAGLAEWICARLPAHVYYAEPFAGHGGVLRSKLPSLRSYIVDRDEEVLGWWERLARPGVIARLGDGIRWCELAADWAPPELLIYCDPPYLPETRVKRKVYRHEMSRADHERLLKALTRCRCSVAISGYASKLYDEALAGWRRYSRWCITRGGTLREEILWTSGEPVKAAIGVGYSDLGETFRQRERVNRKADRWASRLLAMPPAERRAVYLRLVDSMRLGRNRRA